MKSLLPNRPAPEVVALNLVGNGLILDGVVARSGNAVYGRRLILLGRRAHRIAIELEALRPQLKLPLKSDGNGREARP